MEFAMVNKNMKRLRAGELFLVPPLPPLKYIHTPYISEIVDVLGSRDQAQEVVIMKGQSMGLSGSDLPPALCYLHYQTVEPLYHRWVPDVDLTKLTGRKNRRI